jgi:hypothetical protein
MGCAPLTGVDWHMEAKLPEDMHSSKSDLIARLAHAFIVFSLKDGEQASHEVSSALASIQMLASQCAEQAADAPSGLQENLAQLLQKVSEAVINLQFYDRMSQRLDHAARCIKALESVGLQSNLDHEFDTDSLFKLLTMEDERVLFKSIEQGEPVEHAVELANQSLQSRVSGDDDIELF